MNKIDFLNLLRVNTNAIVVCTGGEPLLQNISVLFGSVTKSDEREFHVETNGTIRPDLPFTYTVPGGPLLEKKPFPFSVIKSIKWVVSPKIDNELCDYTYWRKLPNVCMKFIITNEEELNKVDGIVSQYRLNRKKVYVGIKGTTRTSQYNTRLVDAILSREYNYSPRLHILLWGNRPGR